MIGKGPKRAPPTPTATQLIQALGFTSEGKNAFKDVFSQDRKIRAALRYKDLISIGKPSPSALKEVMEWLGEADESNTRKMIKEGRHLLGLK